MAECRNSIPKQSRKDFNCACGQAARHMRMVFDA